MGVRLIDDAGSYFRGFEGLKSFCRIIGCLFLFLGFGTVVSEAVFDHTHNDFDILLHRYVHDGRVAYRELARNREILDSYLNMVEIVKKEEFGSWTEKQKLAFLINAYNAYALKQVLDNYPVESIQKTGNMLTKALDRKVARLFGKKLSLNNLRDNLIRGSFNDPRYHFGLVTAARGGPDLRSQAYLPARLYSQLDNSARDFLRKPYKNRFEVSTKMIYLSEMFQLYVEDFSKPAGSVLKFIGRYLPADQRRMLNLDPKELTIRFLPFDWTINQ